MGTDGHRWGSIPAAAHRPPVPRGGSACCDIRHPMLWKRDLLHVLIHGLSADVGKTKSQGIWSRRGELECRPRSRTSTADRPAFKTSSEDPLVVVALEHQTHLWSKTIVRLVKHWAIGAQFWWEELGWLGWVFIQLSWYRVAIWSAEHELNPFSAVPFLCACLDCASSVRIPQGQRGRNHDEEWKAADCVSTASRNWDPDNSLF
jgi:hypothetical protein